jgi:hypothetical protein
MLLRIFSAFAAILMMAIVAACGANTYVVKDFCLIAERPTYSEDDTEATKLWMDRHAIAWERLCPS